MLTNRASIAILIFVLATFFFIWSQLHSPPQLADPHGAHAKLHVELLKQNEQLQHELELARASATLLATASATSVTPDQSSTSFAAQRERGRYAYVFYATSDAYACSVLVNIHRLYVLNTSLPFHVLASPDVSESYVKALEEANAIVHIETPPPLFGGGGGYYQGCLLKLVAFKMHELAPGVERVLVLDGDQLIMRNMDFLFALPEVDVAAPRAYWLAKDFISSTFMMISLSQRLWQTVNNAMQSISPQEYDMDLINKLFGETAMVLSGEYVTINSHWEDWNLPRWFHPSSKLNWTTIELINKFSKNRKGIGDRKREHSSTENNVPSETTGPQDDGHTGAVVIVSSSTNPVAGSSPSLVEAPFQSATNTSTLPPKPVPRFPISHPIYFELERLQEAAVVVHFYALGKPWVHTSESISTMRPDCHPLLADQFKIWRQTANDVCPGDLLSLSGSK